MSASVPPPADVPAPNAPAPNAPGAGPVDAFVVDISALVTADGAPVLRARADLEALARSALVVVVGEPDGGWSASPPAGVVTLDGAEAVDAEEPGARLARAIVAGGASGARTMVIAGAGTELVAAARRMGVATGSPSTPGSSVSETVRAALVGRVGPFGAAAMASAGFDEEAAARADARQLQLTKPPGSLGEIEALGTRLAGMVGSERPPVMTSPAVAVFAGDHGVHARGVTPWPQEVTAQMVANFLTGGAAVSVLADLIGASVTVVDVGVATDLPPLAARAEDRLRRRRIRSGTADLFEGPAMSPTDCLAALDVGASIAAELVAGGADLLVTGDMGIANTTPSACLIAAWTGTDAGTVTGRGTGIDDEMLTHKRSIVGGAVERAIRALGDPGHADPLLVLASLGGLEHAALAGFVVGAAGAGVPVVVDGVIAGAGLLAASRLVPGCERYAIAGHRSVEPAASIVLDALGLRPLLDLDLRLGEGTGAVLAVPLVRAAAAVLSGMATFAEAGVADS